MFSFFKGQPPSAWRIKSVIEIGTPEINIYMKDFSFFGIFSKKALTTFLNWYTYQES